MSSWLRDSVGLPQLEQTFFENDVTSLLVVKLLTDADLKEIGISLGHRKLLLVAIAKLNQSPQNRHLPTATFVHTHNVNNRQGFQEEQQSTSTSTSNKNYLRIVSTPMDDEMPPGEC